MANAKDKRNWEGMGIEIVLGVGGCFTEKNDTTSVSSSRMRRNFPVGRKS